MAICAFIVMTHIVPHAIDLGINQVQAATILSFIGGTSILGTLFMGRASDIMGRKPAILISTLLMAGAMLWLIWSSSLWMLYLFAVIFGFSYGGISSPVNAFIGDAFGTRHIGVILAITGAPFSVGAAVGPALAGYIFDISGSYLVAFLASMVATLITAILALFLRVPKAKEKEQAIY
ncbi:MFS transporter [Chloroflexota bacterium]